MSDLVSANWAESDAGNNANPPNGWPEGMAPSDVNNSARANMGALKRWWDRSNTVLTTGGTSTAYTLTNTVAGATYYAGEEFAFIVNATCGATPSLNVDGLGAANLRKFVGSAWATLAAGDLVANQFLRAYYNSVGPSFDIVAQPNASKPITIQSFTTGTAATYTTAAATSWIRVVMIGGGGGGGGTGTGSPTNGVAGGNTSFNSIVANGGAGAGAAGGSAGSGGGGGTGGSGSANLRVAGANGGGGSNNVSGIIMGGNGAGSHFGTGAQAFFGGGSGVVASSPGTGGSGGGVGGTTAGSGGGGAGEYVELIINAPSATYTYTVGAVGSGGIGNGSGSTNGGSGAAGIIIVYEYH